MLAVLGWGASLWANGGDPGNALASANVNSRYTVESVNVSPVGLARLSAPLRDRLQQLVGARFDQALLEDAARRLRTEFRNRPVTTDVSKGSSPEVATSSRTPTASWAMPRASRKGCAACSAR